MPAYKPPAALQLFKDFLSRPSTGTGLARRGPSLFSTNDDDGDGGGDDDDEGDDDDDDDGCDDGGCEADDDVAGGGAEACAGPVGRAAAGAATVGSVFGFLAGAGFALLTWRAGLLRRLEAHWPLSEGGGGGGGAGLRRGNHNGGGGNDDEEDNFDGAATGSAPRTKGGFTSLGSQDGLTRGGGDGMQRDEGEVELGTKRAPKAVPAPAAAANPLGSALGPGAGPAEGEGDEF